MKLCFRIMTIKNNQDQKSIKIPFATYADTESLLEKTQICDNNLENY